jgi:hypothetical protein
MASYTQTPEEFCASIVAYHRLLKEGHDPRKLSQAKLRILQKRRDPVKVAGELIEEMQERPSSAKKRRRESPKRGADPARRDFFTITDLAGRWGVSRGTVYNVLRRCGAKVVDLAPRGRRGRKVVPAAVLLEIERRLSKRLR